MIFIFLCISLLFSYELFVRVGIKDNVKSFQVFCDEKNYVIVRSYNDKILKKIINPFYVVLSRDGKKVKILNESYFLPLKLYSKSNISIDGKFYPGTIEIFSKNKSLILVNVLDIENYLYGVIPYEVVSSWPDEMLKVQAIIARTYTISHLGRHKYDGYDVCSTFHCQVYNGISEKMHQRVKEAVDATRGLVIVDKIKNTPIQAYYHAACGGATDNVVEIWGDVCSFRYLCGVKCDFCKNSPYYQWEYEIKIEEFIKTLNKNGFSLKNIKKLQILSYTKNGRAKEIKIITENLPLIVKAEDLRKMFGYTSIKSTKINDIEIRNKNIIFSGKGWGHGVGLCQWGAATLAFKGKSFKEIISYYYPFTTVKKYR
ncbi:MAG: SpoIID/LytB domain-containing protein [Endomicrobiia bacterium]